MNEDMNELIQDVTNQILVMIAFKNKRFCLDKLPDRYLPMPVSDFAALSRLTTPESCIQFKAAVVSATALAKFKHNSSYYPEFYRPVIQAGG